PMAASNVDSSDGEPPTVAAAKPNQSQPAESSRLRRSQDGFAARAVTLLRSAADAGYLKEEKAPSSILLANSNLAALVGRDDFQSFLSNLDAAAAEKTQKKK
ncbi:MAG TPA: hypothetical protein VKB78_15085, partial [Pirellulales bacterium]|nr:hypothetical protein [Pirellulales bacterium]